MNQFLHHLAEDAMPALIEKLSEAKADKAHGALSPIVSHPIGMAIGWGAIARTIRKDENAGEGS